MQEDFRDHSYAESPVGVTLSNVLRAVKQIKQKYADVDESSVSRTHANDLMNFAQWALEVAHDKVLPEFNRGNLKPSCPNVILLGFWALKVKSNKYLFSTREFTLYMKAIELVKEEIPALIKKNRKAPSGVSKQEQVCSLLEANKKSLYKEAEKLPGVGLDNFFSELLKAIREKKLFSDAFDVDIDQSKKKIELDIDEAWQSDIAYLEFHLFGPGAQFEDGCFSFEHFHPMFFEVVVEIVKLTYSLPRQLNKAIPFLSPASINHYAETVPLVGALETFGLISHYHFKHTGPADFKGPHDVLHQYQLLLQGPKEDEKSEPLWDMDLTINASLEYNIYFDFIYSILLTRLVNYQKSVPGNKAIQLAMKSLLATVQEHFKRTIDSDDFKSEQARASLLKRHVSKGLNNIQTILDDIPSPGKGFQELSGIDLIVALDKEISREQKKADKHSQLLQFRKELYSRSFRSEISLDEELTGQLEADKLQGCDISYAQSPMPDYMFDLDGENTVKLIPIRSHLREALDTKINALNYDESCEAKLTALRDDAISTWVSAKIRGCTIDVRKLQDEIELKQKRVLSLNAERKKKETDTTDIQSLESTLETLLQEEKELLVVKTFAGSIADRNRELLTVPDRARSFPLLVDTLASTVGSLDVPVKKLSDLTESALSSLKNERSDLEEDLALARKKAEEKALAEAEYARNMAALNIKTLEQRLREESQRSEALSLCKDTLTHERDQTVGKLVAIGCNDLSFLNNETLNFKAQLDDLENSTRLLAVQALGKLPKDQTLPDLEASIEDPGALIQLLSTSIQAIDERLSTEYSFQHILDFLIEVKRIMASTEDRTEIKVIERLPYFVGKNNGFMKLVCMLFTQDEMKGWQEYYDAEMERWTFVASDRKKSRRDQLFSRLEAKIKELNHKITVDQQVDIALAETLRTIVRQLQNNRSKVTLIKLQSTLKKEEAELAKIAREASQLQSSLKALHPCVGLLREMGALRERIDSFCKNERKFNLNLVHQGFLPELYTEVVALNQLLVELQKKVSSFHGLVNTEEFQETYLLVAGNMQKLFDSMSRQFTDSIKDKFSSVENDVKTLKRNIVEFKTKATQFSEGKELYQEAVDLLADQDNVSGLLKKLREVIDEGQHIEYYETVLREVEESVKALPAEIRGEIERKFGITISTLDGYVQEIENQYTQVNALYTTPTFEGDIFTEEIIKEIDTKLLVARQCLLFIQQRYATVREVNSNVLLILKDQKKSDLIFCVMNQLSSLEQNLHTLLRGVMGAKMLSDLSVQFAQYQADRPKLDSGRVAYILELQRLLLAAAKDRKCETVMRSLKVGVRAYSGTRFGQLLNQMIVDILDFTRCGHNPNNEPLPLHNDAVRRSKEIGDERSKRTFAKIYRNLAEMQEFARKELQGEQAKVVEQLAIKLRVDLDRFILKHEPGDKISSKEYKRFKDTFNARLHTQDLIIKQYMPLWAIVASIFMMVLSLGSQPLYSLFHGRSALYFENKVEVRKQMAVMENVVSKEHKFLPRDNGSQTR